VTDRDRDADNVGTPGGPADAGPPPRDAYGPEDSFEKEPSWRRPRAVHYVAQSLLATLVVGAALLILQGSAGMVVVASLGSTSFLVFARPKTYGARPHMVIGGELVCVACGAACAVACGFLFPESGSAVILLSAAAVGLATLGMTLTDTEHAPAAGVALAMVIGHDEMLEIASVAVAGAVIASMASRLLRPWMRDLT